MGGDLSLAWEALVPLIAVGFTIGVVLAVIFGAIKIGWNFAPYIFGWAGQFLVLLLSNMRSARRFFLFW